MTEPAFPELRLSGDARARGQQHGEMLREPIAETLDYYRGLFGLGEAALRETANRFASHIHAFSEDYAEEIEAIARAANLDAYSLYALNSRSEIFNNASVAECTAIYSEQEGVLAQNWDWSETLESLLVLLRIEYPDGHALCTLTEPGIIGKIGFNSAGIGVCLNILKHPRALDGLPVHVLLRALLDCRDFRELQSVLEAVCLGKASHVLVADDSGRSLSVEFAGELSHLLPMEQGLRLHTNHYLAEGALEVEDAFPSTHERLQRARDLLAQDGSPEGIRAMLRDQTMAEMSICRQYSPTEIEGFGNVGTVFTVSMDLAGRSMEIQRGPELQAPPYRVHL